MKILIIFLLSLNGCILVPFINAYNEAGLSPESRKEKLPKQLRLFSNNLGMSGSGGINLSQFIVPEKRREILTQILKPERKIVDVKISFVDFNEDGTDASVDLGIRSYEIPYYVVKQTVQHTKWKYDGDWIMYEMDLN